MTVPAALQGDGRLADALSRDPLAVRVGVAWGVEWSDVLALELRLSQGVQAEPGLPPDLLVLHLKGSGQGGGPQEYEGAGQWGPAGGSGLARVLAFPPGTARAVVARAALQRVRRRYVDDSWAAGELVAAAVGGAPAGPPAGAPQLLPGLMPCVAYRRQWLGGADHRTRRPALSVWRPVPPPGYVSVGDVISVGAEEPPGPALCLRAGGGPEGAAGGPPPVAPPVDFLLAWRDAACPGQPVTLWEPVPPAGYVALGFVAVPQLEEPRLAAVRCVRADLCFETQVAGAEPLWAGVSADASRSGASIWQVDNESRTFVVDRPRSDGTVPRPGRVLGLLGAP